MSRKFSLQSYSPTKEQTPLSSAMKTILLSCCAVLFLSAVIQAQVVNVCYDVPDATFVPNPEDCSKYYTCFQNVAYANDCPKGFEFNVEEQMCDYPTNAKCQTCAKDAQGLSFIPIFGVCNKYIICVDGKAFYQACAGGLEFDSTEYVCNFATKANCTVKPAQCPEDKIGQLTFITSGDCSRYTICYKEIGYLQTCAVDTVFDVNQRSCVPSTQYTCNASSLRSNLPLLAQAKSSRFEMKLRSDANCPTEGTKSIPDPSNCSGYYFCVDGKSAKLSCAQGLHFDSKTLTCRTPRDATCAF